MALKDYAQTRSMSPLQQHRPALRPERHKTETSKVMDEAKVLRTRQGNLQGYSQGRATVETEADSVTDTQDKMAPACTPYSVRTGGIHGINVLGAERTKPPITRARRDDTQRLARHRCAVSLREGPRGDNRSRSSALKLAWRSSSPALISELGLL